MSACWVWRYFPDPPLSSGLHCPWWTHQPGAHPSQRALPQAPPGDRWWLLAGAFPCPVWGERRVPRTHFWGRRGSLQLQALHQVCESSWITPLSLPFPPSDSSVLRCLRRYKASFVNVPLGLIESIEARDIFYLHIYCKDAHTFRWVSQSSPSFSWLVPHASWIPGRITFNTNEACVEWFKRLMSAVQPPSKLQDVFAFAFHAWCRDSSGRTDSCDPTFTLCRLGKPFNWGGDTGAGNVISGHSPLLCGYC